MSDLLSINSPAFIQSLFDGIGQIGHSGLTTTLVTGLVLAGLVAIAMLAVHTSGCVRQVRQAVTAVEMANGELDFARHFGAISASVEDLPLLREPWGRFKATLLLPRGPGAADMVIRSTSSPAEYFSPASLKEHWRFYRALPGLFLTVTLLLTVTGIVGSMAGALQWVDDSRGVLASDQAVSTAPLPDGVANAGDARSQNAFAERMQGALRQLLDAGGTTFSVAIAGLLISFLLTIAVGLCSASLVAALQALVAALEQRVMQISFEATVLQRLAGGYPDHARTPRAGSSEPRLNVALAIQQALPVHIDAAMAKLQAALERNAASSADANSATLRNLAEDFRRLLEARVSEPVEGMTEQMLRLRGQMLGLINLVSDGKQPAGSASSTSLGDEAIGSARPGLSGYLQALQQGPLPGSGVGSGVGSGLDEAEMRELIEHMSARLETRIAEPINGVTSELTGLHVKLAAIETAISGPRASASGWSAGNAQVEGAPSAGPDGRDTRMAADLSRLAASLERSTTQAALSTHAALEQLLAEHFARLDAGVSGSMRAVSVTIDDVRSKLAMLEAASGSQPIAGTTTLAQLRDIDRANAEMSRLRQSVDDVASRIAAANQVAIADMTSAVVERLDGLADPQQRLAEILVGIEGRLAGLEAPFVVAGQAITGGSNAESQAGQLESLRSTLLMTIRQANDKLADYNLQLANALAEDFAQRLETVANPVKGLAETLNEVKQGLESARLEASRTDGDVALRLTAAAEDVRLATSDMKGSVGALTSQAQVEAEAARCALHDKIEESIEALGQATRQFEANGAAIATQLRQVIDTAPLNLAREAEAAARLVSEATETASQRLEATVTAMSEATARDTSRTAEALTQISEQLVRQSVHARDVLNEQLASTTSGVDRAMTAITLAFDSLNGSLAKGTATATKDVLSQLAVATAELSAVARQSSAESVQSAAGIWQAATQVRVMIASDLEKIREQILQQAEQVNSESAARLRDTAADVANMMAGYGGDLSAVTGTLVQTLQALSVEMRRLQPNGSMPDLGQSANEPGFGQPLLAVTPSVASVDGETPEVMLGRFILSLRAVATSR